MKLIWEVYDIPYIIQNYISYEIIFYKVNNIKLSFQMKKQSMSKTDWKYAYIYIHSNDLMKKTKPNWAMNTYFIFWVEHGIGYRTDVAFDDVQLVPRRCKDLPSMKELPPLPPRITNRPGYTNSDLNHININIMVDSELPTSALPTSLFG